MPQNTNNSKRGRSISALIVMFCTMLSRILGFVKVAIINAVFGASGQADVLNAVFSIPNNLRKLMAEGALSSAFIPELNNHIASHNVDKAKILTRQIMAFQYLILIPLIALSIIFKDDAIKMFTNFASDENQKLAADIFQYFSPYLLLVSISAIIMAVLNSHNHFLIPALSPLLFSFAIIGAIFFLSPQYGIYSMAIGVLIGGVLQILLLLFPYAKEKYNVLPLFSFNDDSFKKVLKHWFPVLLTSSAFAVNQQISMLLATSLIDGSSSALINAVVFFNLPYGIFSASVNTVFFPKMSRLASLENYDELQEALISGLKILLAFLLPAALIMGVLGKEIISVAFARGAFTSQNTYLAATTLACFCFGMFFVAGYNFFQRYFYSRKSFNTPFVSAIFVLVLDVSLSLILIKTPLGVMGLAIANSLTFFIAFFILAIWAYVKYGSLKLSKLIIPTIKILLSCFLGFLAYKGLVIALQIEPWWQEVSSLKNFLYLTMYGLVMSVVILLCYKIFNVEFLEGLKRKK